jgi:hypothetical protein
MADGKEFASDERLEAEPEVAFDQRAVAEPEIEPKEGSKAEPRTEPDESDAAKGESGEAGCPIWMDDTAPKCGRQIAKELIRTEGALAHP